MTGDRAHPYDLLVMSGWSRPAASAMYVAVEAVVVTTVAVIGTPSMAVAVAVDVAVAGVVLGGAAFVGGLSDPAGTRP